MKITESKLRKIIREVITELTGTSSSRGSKRSGHKTAEKGTRGEPTYTRISRPGGRGSDPVTTTHSSKFAVWDDGSGPSPQGWFGSREGQPYGRMFADAEKAAQGGLKPHHSWKANPDYKAWEKEKRDAQKKDTKATREKPKGQKDPAASARRPSGKKGSKKKGKNKDDE